MDLKKQAENEFLHHILPFWMEHAMDHENGGFYGKIHNNIHIENKAPKGSILHSRILWTFSAAYRVYKEPAFLQVANYTYHYLLNHLWDQQHRGVYWLVDWKGQPLDTTKYLYAQAFALYAFSEYFKATGIQAALDMSVILFELMEKYGYEPGESSYIEAYDRRWTAKGSSFVSDREGKTMNTSLHIVEAYTNFYQIWKKKILKEKLKELVEMMNKHVLDKDTGHFKLSFDREWNSLADHYSYGHDIEGSWLLYKALLVIDDDELREKNIGNVIKIADTTLKEAIDTEGGIMETGKLQCVTNSDRIWWVQAEAVIGFMNAYHLTGREEFISAAKGVWGFISSKIIDHVHGEWVWGISQDGSILRPDAKVDMWKGPYHNGRMCLEIVEGVS